MWSSTYEQSKIAISFWVKNIKWKFKKVCFRHMFEFAWRKAIRAIWKLLFRTHCNLLHGINDTLPIDVMLEQRFIKFIWTLLHSPNIIVKYVMRSAIWHGHFVLGENFRYLSYKYDLSSTLWISSLCKVYKCLNDYVTDFIVILDISYFIRELYICRDSGNFYVLASTEMA